MANLLENESWAYREHCMMRNGNRHELWKTEPYKDTAKKQARICRHASVVRPFAIWKGSYSDLDDFYFRTSEFGQITTNSIHDHMYPLCCKYWLYSLVRQVKAQCRKNRYITRSRHTMHGNVQLNRFSRAASTKPCTEYAGATMMPDFASDCDVCSVFVSCCRSLVISS